MAPTPVDLALHSLLPILSDLPPDLVNLAQSLLSQSKIKAAQLKQDEEVGRIYACCHIAAERLRNKHALEVGKARPPVPPRVYAKLKGFLEGLLGGPTTPRGRRVGGDVASGSVAGKKTPESRPTSMRKRWAEARRPKLSGAVDGGERGEEVAGGIEVPGYAMPMIRHLCKACDATKAAPHVFTGVSVVLKAFGRQKEEALTPGSGRKRKRGAVEDEREYVAEDDIPGVVLALFIAVVRRIYGAEKLMGGEHLDAARDFAADERSGAPQTASEETYFDDALSRFDTSAGGPGGKWTEMEWFGNVPEAESSVPQPGDLDIEDEDEEVHDLTLASKKPAKTPLRRKEKHGKFNVEDGDYTTGRAGLLPGLGTMFQPALDWLSDDRMIEFERWKKEVGREIAVIDSRG